MTYDSTWLCYFSFTSFICFFEQLTVYLISYKLHFVKNTLSPCCNMLNIKFLFLPISLIYLSLYHFLVSSPAFIVSKASHKVKVEIITLTLRLPFDFSVIKWVKGWVCSFFSHLIPNVPMLFFRHIKRLS